MNLTYFRFSIIFYSNVLKDSNFFCFCFFSPFFNFQIPLTFFYVKYKSNNKIMVVTMFKLKGYFTNEMDQGILFTYTSHHHVKELSMEQISRPQTSHEYLHITDLHMYSCFTLSTQTTVSTHRQLASAAKKPRDNLRNSTKSDVAIK